MLNRDLVYMAVAAFVAQAIGSRWVSSEHQVLMTFIGFLGALVGLAAYALIMEEHKPKE
jgi:uncharacterized membrane protein YeaQ/YmgE (transglycosylase-associated protein family)